MPDPVGRIARLPGHPHGPRRPIWPTLRRLPRDLAGVLGIRTGRMVAGVRYEPRTGPRLASGGRAACYAVRFPGGQHMRILPGPTRVYDDLAPAPRAVAVRAIARRLTPGGRALDLGCGTGASTAALFDALGTSGSAIGIDHDSESIRFARRRYRAANLDFERGDLAAVAAEPEAAFDVLLADAPALPPATTRSPDPLSSLLRLLTPGGEALFFAHEAHAAALIAALREGRAGRRLPEAAAVWRGSDAVLIMGRLTVTSPHPHDHPHDRRHGAI